MSETTSQNKRTLACTINRWTENSLTKHMLLSKK